MRAGPRKRFRLTAPEPDELATHKACASTLDKCLLPPAMWTTNPMGHLELSHAETARLSAVGAKRGWPDINIIYAEQIYGLEIKRRGGTLSKTRVGRTKRGELRVYQGQQEIFPLLEAAGMKIAVVHSVGEMLTQLSEWKIPLRWAHSHLSGPPSGSA